MKLDQYLSWFHSCGGPDITAAASMSAPKNGGKKLEDKLLYQEVHNRRENLRFFGVPESTTGVQNTFSVMHNFLKEELNLENEENIEFKRAHRIGKKKPGETRPVIVRFLKFPERERVLEERVS